ncbi:RNA polymerase II C-terminal domain phosphatase-like 1 isoform X3 [Olea europaea var. sylvestris]|uniref:RNA polymerase II C-terminal domain phosphatase-like 1 isoform X3 n=1 Tax=Olea europaea var. sylvestris TaxID=158386 RepID=UPI000C1D3126|nr:RNA polymerase II C-terminal domain phosphatase-like 1 isoform X3 [Olea europaea var. sylvestris]
MYGKSVVVYEGERVLGEVVVYSKQSQDGVVWGERLKEIRISHYSQPSERCPPLAVLHTITSTGIAFKSESLQHQDSLLSVLHATCLRDNKTAVMTLGGEELHLVAMHSRKYEGQVPCFWGFNVASGLYNSCLVMLNLRCLGIVFDLDETLIVANTMRSFEDRIEALLRKINSESDPQRVAGMMAEFKRYQDDKGILKQYAEKDQVVDNGKVIKSQSEVVPALSNNLQPTVRPLIRLQDKNIILTRINPLIRDTSVLVRLRPAWEDLRSYLTATGRKRFEVFVCTMAERDYALEMWRLLDPESNLIDSKELLDRIVCVKAGCRKSLFNVFQVGNCHPKMTLVVDDRLKVWDEKDQPRVHVVPAFAPYYAPQAEANNTIPILCVARNVACNVRGRFFKEFDEVLLQRMSGVAYEDDIKEVPSPPDVSNYLISEDNPSVSNGNKDSIGFDGMADAEVERRLLKDASSASSTAPLTMARVDPRIASPLQSSVPSSSFSVPPTTMEGPASSFPNQQLPQLTTLLKPPLAQRGKAETTLQNSPAREEGEVPESELDPDTRRRLLILQHGQDSRDHASVEPQFPAQPPMQVSVPRVPACGWFPIEEEMSPRQLNRVIPPKEIPSIPESIPIDEHRPHHLPFIHTVESSVPPGRVLESQSLPKEALPREEPLKLNRSLPNFYSLSGEDAPIAQPSSGNKDLDLEAGQIDPYPETPAGALQDIAYKCGTKVEFRQVLVSSMELQFSVEVLFAGEKIGEGIASTRREAQHEAAKGSLMTLADKYLSRKPDSSSMAADGSRFANSNDNGFIRDAYPIGYQPLPKEETTSFSIASESPRILDPRLEASKKSMGSITELKELGLGVAFQTQPQFSANPGQKNEVYAQVEIDGQVLGKGIGLTWDEAKTQAAEKGLGTLRSMPNQFPYKRQDSPWSLQGMSNKRFKSEFSRSFQRMPSSARYPKNASPML